MSLHQRPFEPGEQSFADRTPYFSDVFNRAHGHDDNPSIGAEVAEAVAATLNAGRGVLGAGIVTAEHKGGGRLEVSHWPDDDDGSDPDGTIVTFQAVRP